MSESEDHEIDSGVRVITRIADILNILADAPRGLTYYKIAKTAGLPRTTVFRLVKALEDVGFVQPCQIKGVTLGPDFLRLVAHVHTDMVTALQPGLKTLAGLTGETVVLTRPSGRKLSVIHAEVAAGELQVKPQLGLGLPLYQTAAGRALLALQPDEAVHDLFATEFRPPLDCPIQTLAALLESIGAVRESGVSYDRGEMIEGVNMMAVGVCTRIGELSVGILLPSGRSEKKHTFCRESLQEFEKNVSRGLGF